MHSRRTTGLRLVLLLTVQGLAFPSKAQAQSIMTIAGGGTDDGRLATEASILARGVFVDRAGNILIADVASDSIRRVEAGSGVISKIAGNGTMGFSGDGGPATEASLSRPLHAAADAAGNVYIAEESFLRGRVRMVAAGTGIISTFAGGGSGVGDGGPATAANLVRPSAVAIDSDGNVYIADNGNNRIRKVSAKTGLISTIAGNGTAGFAGDGGPATAAALRLSTYDSCGIAVDAAGNVYVPDYGNDRVRVVTARDGVISTIAGNGTRSFSGDGGPAVAASLAGPVSVAVDPAGNVYIADRENSRIRLVSASNGVISTFAGGAASGLGDGGPASAARLLNPSSVALDAERNLYIADYAQYRIRKVTAASGVITTVAGSGTVAFLGDGGPATSASLRRPQGVAMDGSGNLYIADWLNNRIRKVAAASGIITTAAGSGDRAYGGDGGPAILAGINWPVSVQVGPGGDLYIVDNGNCRIRKVDAATGIITTVAGFGQREYGGDGGPATAAGLSPEDVAVDSAGNLYIVDMENNRVRRVAANSGIISTVAGRGSQGFSGDGGPATAAELSWPSGVAVDSTGNLFIADMLNGRVRKVSALDGTISTVAGNGTGGFPGDGAPATSAGLSAYRVAVDASGDLLISGGSRISRVFAGTGLIWQVAGTGAASYSGDGGSATTASLAGPAGLAVDGAGNVFVADDTANRARAVFACTPLSPPGLTSPAGGSSHLSWTPVAGAFRYDVYLDTTNPPAMVLAGNLAYSTPTPFTIPAGTSYTYSVSNLLPGTAYHWKVVAKGDPFCPSVSTASSEIRSFTTAGGCTAPAYFSLSSPADGATGVTSGVLLSWQAASGAGSYDVSLGSSNPPPLAASGATGTSFNATGLTAGATYYWSVTARASCDPTKTTTTPVRTFVVAGGCSAPGTFAPQSPTNGGTGTASNPTLSWSASANASSYDVYLGTSSTPPLHLADVSKTSAVVTGLAPGATYFWKVVAKTSCNPNLTSTFAVQSFTVAGTCHTPGATTIAFVPPGNVGASQTYVVAWTDAPGLDPGGGYVVERSANASFSPLLDSQTTTATAASFTSASEGARYHRVRALPGCDPAKAGPWSASRSVTVVTGTPDVIFTVQPAAVVTALGEKIDDNKKTSFTLENIGKAPLTLQLTQQFLGPIAFFTIVDPYGGSVNGFTLEPRKPKTFDLKFQGADANVSDSYQGVVIVLQANFQPLAIAPFAFVNLKVGGTETAVPSFEVGGVTAEYASFTGAPGERPTRTLSVDVVNAGASPMDLATDVGPEIWLVPQPGWNSIPIPPRSKRTVTFTTDRTRAPNGSALPRYTYFTVRTKAGQTARLLVQDNGPSDLGQGRSSQLLPGVRSYVVPSVVRATSKIRNSFVTKLRLSNVGSDPVQADLFYTPRDADGFSADVRRATVVVPANDVVTLTNPLVQLYGFPTDANVSGQLEVRAALERIGSLTVTSSVDAPAPGGGTFGFQMPTASRGEGARVGQPHSISGITFTASYRTNLILAETSGVDHASVRATLFDRDGNRKGDTLLDVPRYGQKQVAVTDLGAPDGLEAGQIELVVESGGGAAVGLVTVIDNTNDDAVTYVGRPVAGSSGAAQTPNLLARLAPPLAWAKAAASFKYVVPAVVNGYATFRDSPLPYTFQSLMGFTGGRQSAATFRLTYKDLNTGQSIPRTVTVPGRSTREYQNVLEELFGIPKGQKSQGPVFVETDGNGTMYCKVFSILQSGTLGDAFPVVPVPSEGLTGNGSAKPIYVDGLEQSVDTGRGTRSNLILNEVTGLASATVLVQLYEPGNRSTPIARQEVFLAAGEKKQLSTVFSGLGLETAERNKDRINVLCVVTATSGSGLVSAVVTTIDNKTGDTKNSLLTPTGGVSASKGNIGI